MGIRNKKLNIFIFTSFFMATSLVPLVPKTTSAYAPNCVSAACHAAADKESAARERAASASQSANDVAGMVAALDADIAVKEAEIAAKQTLANDLNTKVQQTSKELEKDQAGLAKLLVKNHFDKEPSTIALLASSATIGELSSAEARQETVRDQISSAVKQVSDKKKQIEEEKSSVDAILTEMNNQNAALAKQRSERSATVARYQADAASARAEANAANQKVAQEIAAEIARHNSGGQTGGGGGNTYPWANICPGANMSFMTTWGYVCQCVSYAGYKANEYWGGAFHYSGWGNANTWAYYARQAGYRVDYSPAPHTIAVDTSGAYGHVMWVESVNGNGTINLSEYNNYGSSLSHLPGDYGTRVNVPAGMYQYIHIGD